VRVEARAVQREQVLEKEDASLWLRIADMKLEQQQEFQAQKKGWDDEATAVRRVCADLDTAVKDQDDRIRQYTVSEIERLSEGFQEFAMRMEDEDKRLDSKIDTLDLNGKRLEELIGNEIDIVNKTHSDESEKVQKEFGAVREDLKEHISKTNEEFGAVREDLKEHISKTNEEIARVDATQAEGIEKATADIQSLETKVDEIARLENWDNEKQAGEILEMQAKAEASAAKAEALAERVTEVEQGVVQEKESVEARFTEVKEGFEGSLKETSDDLEVLKGLREETATKLDVVEERVEKSGTRIDDVDTQMEQLKTTLEETNAEIEKKEERLGKCEEDGERLTQIEQTLVESALEEKERQAELLAKVEECGTRLDEVNTQMEPFESMEERLVKVEEYGARLDEVNTQLESFESMEERLVKVEEYGARLDEVDTQMEQLKDSLEEAKSELELKDKELEAHLAMVDPVLEQHTAALEPLTQMKDAEEVVKEAAELAELTKRVDAIQADYTTKTVLEETLLEANEAQAAKVAGQGPAEDQLADLRTQLEGKAEKEDLDAVRDELRQIAALESKAEQKDLEALREELSQLEKDLEELNPSARNAEAQATREAVEQLQKTVDDLAEGAEQKEKAGGDQQEEIAVMRSMMDEQINDLRTVVNQKMDVEQAATSEDLEAIVERIAELEKPKTPPLDSSASPEPGEEKDKVGKKTKAAIKDAVDQAESALNFRLDNLKVDEMSKQLNDLRNVSNLNSKAINKVEASVRTLEETVGDLTGDGPPPPPE